MLCRSHDDQRVGSFLKQRISMALQIGNAACVSSTSNLVNRTYCPKPLEVQGFLCESSEVFQVSATWSVRSEKFQRTKMDCQNYQQYLWKTMLLGIRRWIVELTTMWSCIEPFIWHFPSTTKDIPILNALSVKKASFTTSTSSESFITRLCKMLCRSHDDQRVGSFLKQRISMALQIGNAACVSSTSNLVNRTYCPKPLEVQGFLCESSEVFQVSATWSVRSEKFQRTKMDCQNYQQYLWKTMLLGIRRWIVELTTMWSCIEPFIWHFPSTTKDIPILNALSVKKASFTTSTSSESFITRLCTMLCRSHDDQRVGSFLKQRISMALQIGNAACVLGTVSDRDAFEEIYYI